MEVQQSVWYSRYIQRLGWNVALIDNTYIYYRNILGAGTIVKIQRPDKLPRLPKLIPFLKSVKAKTVALEPSEYINQTKLIENMQTLKNNGFNLNRVPFLPTKTIRVNLTLPESDIFNSFSEAKRRAVRKAIKNQVKVAESQNIQDLISVKNRGAGFLGFITTVGIKDLWPLFYPKYAAIVLGFTNTDRVHPVGGILLLFWKEIAYYWIAGYTKTAKKNFLPTLLVWEAIRLSKSRGCKFFDFLGVWDERLPRQNRDWFGFTKFKEGFGGKELYYPVTK